MCLLAFTLSIVLNLICIYLGVTNRFLQDSFGIFSCLFFLFLFNQNRQFNCCLLVRDLQSNGTGQKYPTL